MLPLLWTVDVGLVHDQVREDVLVPLTSAGAGPALGTGLRHEGDVHHARLHLGLPLSLVTNARGHLAVTYAWDLDATWDARAAELGAWTLAPGVAATGDVEVFFHVHWDDSHVFWRTLWGLGPRVALRRDVGERHLELWGQVPVVGLASRPPLRWTTKVDNVVSPVAHVGIAHRDVQPTSLHQTIDLRGGAALASDLRKGQLAWTLEGRLATMSFPDRITTLSLVAGVERRL